LFTVRIPLSRIFGIFDWVKKAMVGGRHTFSVRYVNLLQQLFAYTGAPNNTIVPVIQNMWWVMPWVKPDILTASMLTAKLESGFVQKFKYETGQTYFCQYPITQNFQWQVTTAQDRPTKLVLAFQNSLQSLGGVYNYNTYSSLVGNSNNLLTGGTYGHGTNAITSLANPPQLALIQASYAGQQFPAQAWQPSITGIAPNYVEYEQVCNRLFSTEDGPVINFNDFQNCLTLYVIDMRFMDNSAFTSGQDSVITLTFTLNNSPVALTGAGAVGNVWATVFSEKTKTLSAVGKKLLIN
jgi:hypothetical protein